MAVATDMETAAAGAATTAVVMPTTAPGVGADRIAFTTTTGMATTSVGAATSVASMTRIAWHFGWGVMHIVQYLRPLLEDAHAPHSQSEAEEEKAMMGGLCMLVVRVVCAGCVCAALSCCFVLGSHA